MVAVCLYLFFLFCVNFEIKTADRTYNFISLYSSVTQFEDEFESFAGNLELNLDSFLSETFTWLLFLVTIMDMHKQKDGIP